MRQLASSRVHDHRLILYSGTRQPNRWPLLVGGVFVVKHPHITANGMDFVGQAVIAGHGIGMLPLQALEEKFADSVELVLPKLVGTASQLHAVYPHRRHLNAAVRAFVDFAQQHVADNLTGSAIVAGLEA